MIILCANSFENGNILFDTYFQLEAADVGLWLLYRFNEDCKRKGCTGAFFDTTISV